jgi:DNA-binding XRE family transcriptional regulator
MTIPQILRSPCPKYKVKDLTAFYKTRNITRVELGEALGVSERTIRRWEQDPDDHLDFRVACSLLVFNSHFPKQHASETTENIDGAPQKILTLSQKLRKSKRYRDTDFCGLILLPSKTIIVALRYENARPLIVLDKMKAELSEQHENYYESKYPKFNGRLENDLERFEIALTLDKLTKPNQAKINVKYTEKY